MQYTVHYTVIFLLLHANIQYFLPKDGPFPGVLVFVKSASVFLKSIDALTDTEIQHIRPY